MWSSKEVVSTYQPAVFGDVSRQLFADRLTVCDTCSQRRLSSCGIARQLVSILARQGKQHCYRWPGDRSATIDLPSESAEELPIQNRNVPRAAHRTIERLVVITSHFNPCGYRRIRENYDRFAEGIASAGVELRSIELAFDADPFQLSDATIQVRGSRRQNLLWQKERLLNHLIDSLPTDVDAVAWIDADILFNNPEWATQTKQALQSLNVVQPFKDAFNLMPDGCLVQSKSSTGFAYYSGESDFNDVGKWHPGFAWAARTDWLRDVGLSDIHLMGGGDCFMLAGFTGCSLSLESQLNGPLLTDLRRWAVAAYERVGGSVGFVPGSITHLYHGSRKDRNYWKRHGYLAEFNSRTDIAIEDNGLWSWTDHAIVNKSAMIERVAGYFAERMEDEG